MSGSAADRQYMQTYFGVTGAQSVRSRYARYTPKAGLHQGEVSLTWMHSLDARWSVTTSVSGTTLLGAAKDSPLVRRRNAPAAAIYASYRY